MNNLIRNRCLLRLLHNEIHNSTITRTVQSSACLRVRDTKHDESKPTADDKTTTLDSTKSPKTPTDATPSATKSNKVLFGALAGMRAVSERTGEKSEQVPVMKKKKATGLKISEKTEFKTAEALKTAMEQATKVVSESFPDKERTESDLVQQLRRYDDAKAAGQRGDVSAISSLLTGMKVEDKDSKKETHWGQKQSELGQTQSATRQQRTHTEDARGMWGQQSMPDQQSMPERRLQKSQMEGFLSRSNKRLGIFSCPDEDNQDADIPQTVEPVTKTIWDLQQENELKELVKGNHRHGFDEMLEWSQDGKLWKYPINNEQGMEEEQTISFHEHVLLDELIDDFPKTGPVREFMELVIVGLSKNPYFTVKQKQEHIEWFRQYFKNKEGVLRETKTITEEFSFASGAL